MTSGRLSDVSPDLERLLTLGTLPPALFEVQDIQCKTVWVTMRDGTRLATDVYLPPAAPAPVVAVRTPYGRSREFRAFAAALFAFARRGYAVVSQDCRGTGGSEPESWDYYMYESEDSYDLIEWIARQDWFGGFIGSCGGSYVGQTQWCMATHPAVSTLVPAVSGLGVAFNTAHLYMFMNAYARVVGKGAEKVTVHVTEMERLFEKETMAGGYFNEPLHEPLSAALAEEFPDLRELRPSQAQRELWKRYCAMTGAQRAESVKQALGVKQVTVADVEALTAIFGHRISHDALTLPHVSPPELCRSIRAPPLLRTGWYDWALNDALETWQVFRKEARPEIAARARIIITPYAHNMGGYREGMDTHTELQIVPTLLDYAGLLLRWYDAVRNRETDSWPAVIYYLMGANEWRASSDWPVPGAKLKSFFLGKDGTLTSTPPQKTVPPDVYAYDPEHPTPTVGGSILSYVYPPGSVDVSEVQKRQDVLVYTTPPLDMDMDVIGPLRMILYASSSAVDTDFVARLSDVFPDGRAIQLQSGILRARYRNLEGEPELLEPGRVYRFEIDLWATANRFKAGHRLRVDISSADFPHFDRNSNRGGEPGLPVVARQTIYRDPRHPSHLLASVLREES